jgi:putative transposase
MSKELPKRKNLRLRGYDYSQNGLYFITFCVHNKSCYLGKICSSAGVNGNIEYRFVPKRAGEILQSVIDSVCVKFENALITGCCIMPNHVHIILAVTDDTSVSEKAGQRSLISRSIGYIKMYSAKRIRLDNPYIPGVWQRGYHDHIIRDEGDHKRIMRYIKANVRHWKEDVFYMQDDNVIIGKVGMNGFE